MRRVDRPILGPDAHVCTRDVIATIPKQWVAAMGRSAALRMLGIRSDRDTHPRLEEVSRAVGWEPFLNERDGCHFVCRRGLRNANVLYKSSANPHFLERASAYPDCAGHINLRSYLTSGLDDFLVLYILQRRDGVEVKGVIRA